MFKYIVIIACVVVAAGCASINAGVSPVKATVETPNVKVPKVEPVKIDVAPPQLPAIVAEQPKVQIPATLNFKRNVTFNHKFHSESFACTKCHKDSPGKIANFGKDFAHETCKGCHKENGQSTACSSCHRG